jgi:hypothetical protein
MIGFIAPYTGTHFGSTDNYSHIVILHTLQFTVTHALDNSVFTSRILATDLSHSQWQFKSHMKSSCNSLTPFLSLFCNCQFQRLDSILLPSLYPSRLASRNSTFHSSSTVVLYSQSTFTFFVPLQPFDTDPTENTSVVKDVCLQFHCLTIDVERICLRGNVFIESLPSKGYTCHNMIRT